MEEEEQLTEEHEKTSDNVIKENSDEQVKGPTLSIMPLTTTIVKKIKSESYNSMSLRMISNKCLQ